MGFHFPAELAASLDRSLDLVPFDHPASLAASRAKLDKMRLRFSQ